VTCSRARELDLAAFSLDRSAPEWAPFRAHYPRCDDCTREVARFAVLAEALARERGAQSEHPAEAELLAFVGSPLGLSDAARERLRLHLAHCAGCRSEAAVLRRFDLAALHDPQHANARERIRAAAGALLGLVRLPRVPALALATAAVVLVMIWAGRERPVAPLQPAPAGIAAEQPSAPRAEPARDSVVSESPSAATAPPQALAHSAPSPSPAPAGESPSEDAAIGGQPGAPPPEPIAPEPPTPDPQRVAALIPSEPPRYEPGALAQGPILRIGGVGRGAVAQPGPQVLAPAQVGFTSQASPTLYWLLPERSEHAVAISVVSEDATAPLMEFTLSGPHGAGVHALSLAELAVQLAPGTTYQWFVASVPDPSRRSRDVVSGAAIRHVPPEAALADRLRSAHPRRAHELAAAGYWYDAFDQLSRWSAAEPESELLRRHRAALLDQVGLEAVAEQIEP
jgi:hypothetical protein